MPVSMEFLRGVLGFIGILCAYRMGSVLPAARRGAVKPSRLYGWMVRTFLCLAAIAIRHAIDTAAIVIWLLAACAFAAALWDASREKKQDELTHTMFPEDR